MDSNLNFEGFTWSFSNRVSPEDDLPLCPLYEYYDVRLSSFENLPDFHAKNAFAKLGYYFASKDLNSNDGLLICYCCGWYMFLEDLLLIKTVSHHNHCNFIRDCMQNNDWVKEIYENDDIDGEEAEMYMEIFRQCQEQIIAENKKLINRVFRLCEYYFYKLKHWIFVPPKFSRICTVCNNKPTEVFFYPCKDAVVCSACAKKCSFCPACKKSFSGIVRHYYDNFKHNAKFFDGTLERKYSE